MADNTAATPPTPPTIEDRLATLEARTAELEQALLSHAAPTIGEPHDAYSKLVLWFRKMMGQSGETAQPPAEDAAPPKA